MEWQRQVNTYVSRALRVRGIRVQRVAIAPADYDAWRGARDDTPDLRREFADGHLRLVRIPVIT